MFYKQKRKRTFAIAFTKGSMRRGCFLFNSIFRFSPAVLAMIFMVLVFQDQAFAAARTASVSGNWNNTATWGGQAIPTAADIITINAGITVTMNVSGNCLQIALMSNGSVIAGSAANQLTLAATGIQAVPGTATISCNLVLPAITAITVTGTLTISGVITGTATSFTKLGAGTLILTGLNTFFGQIFITTGTVVANTLDNLTVPSSLGQGNTNGTINMAVNTTLKYTGTGHSTNRPILLTGANATIDASGSGTLTLSGNVTGNNLGIIFTGTGIGIESGNITTVGGTVTKSGSGTWTLAGVGSTYNGFTSITAGILKLGSTGLAPNSPLGTVTGVTTVATGAVLDLNGFTLATAEPLNTLNGTGISNGGALINSSATAVNYAGAITLGSASLISTTGNISLSSAPNCITGAKDLTKTGPGSLNLGTGASTLGSLTISAGSFTSTTNTLSISGNFSNDVTFNHNNGTVTFTGASAQGIGGVAVSTFNNLIVNKTAGEVLLTQDANISSLLTLTAGNLNAGTRILTLGTGINPVAGVFSAARMIIASGGGEVRKPGATTAQASFTFPVGDATGTYEYSPVTLTFSGGTYAGYSSVKVTNTKHPNNASATNFLKRYWTIAQSGYTGFSCNVRGTYVAADIAGTEALQVAGKYTGTLPWIKYSTLGGTLTANGVTIFGDFTGISAAAPAVTITGNPSLGVCLNAPLTLTANPVGDPVFTYSWNPGGATTQSINPSTSVIGSTLYTVTVTDGNGFTTSSGATVTVSAPPDITATPLSTNIPSGTWTNIALGSTSPGTLFTWTASANSPYITGYSSQVTPVAGPIVQQLFCNTSSGDVTYVITPVLNGCAGTPVTVVITVVNSSVCGGMSSFPAGSCIINMGMVPQTYGNGLKPYGLLYQLVNVSHVPVYWSVNPNKSFVNPAAKVDQPDFTVDGINFKGGPFIIPAEYVPQVQTLINTWVAQGVVVHYAAASFSPPIYQQITYLPNAVLDAANGDLIRDSFYVPAGLPASSYKMGGIPGIVSDCDDIYVLPHAAPLTWPQAQKDSLYNFINLRGWLFSSCNAVSAIESCFSGGNRLSFLSNNGLVLWTHHNDPSLPYAYSTGPGSEALHTASDPFMQFVGTLDGSVYNFGLERVYVPREAGWRPTTKIAVFDSNYINTQSSPDSTYPNTAAIVAYGRAFGDADKGMVMYVAGHNFTYGTEAENCAAARTYANFWLRAGLASRPQITPVSIPVSAFAGQTVTFSINATTSTPPINSYEWSSSCGGIFTTPGSPTTDFITPSVDVTTNCNIQVKVIDACGRINIFCTVLTIFPTIKNNHIEASQLICSGQAAAVLTGTLPTGPGSGTGPYDYVWQSSITNSYSGFGPATGTNNTQNYSPGILTQTTWYRRSVTSEGVTVISETVQVTVNPSPVITATAAPSTICLGQGATLSSSGTTNSTAVLSLTNTSTFIIPNNDPNGISTTVTVAGAPTTITGLISISVTANVTHTADQDVELYLIRPGGTLSNSPNGTYLNTIVAGESIALVADRGGDGDNFTNTVFADAAAQPISAGTPPFTGSFRPENAFSTFTGTANPNGDWTLKALDDRGTGGGWGMLNNWTLKLTYPNNVTYSWSSMPAGYSSNLQNPGNVSPVVTTIYTATVTYLLNNCSANSSATVNVNPVPFIPVQNTSICSGNSFTVTPVNNPPATIVPAGTTYTWGAPVYNPAGSITGGSAQGVGQSTISQTLTNITNNPATATYTIIPTAGSCAGSAFTVIVTVNPTPVIPAQTATICNGGTFLITPVNNPPTIIVPAGTTYTWDAPVISPPGAITGSSAQPAGQASISQTLTNIASITATATYTVTPKSGAVGACTGPPFTVTVTVAATLNPTISGEDSVCKSSQWTYTTEPGMNNYTWTFTGAVKISGGGLSDNMIKLQWVSEGSRWVKVFYKDIYQCTSTTTTLPVFVQKSSPRITGPSEYCKDQTSRFTTEAGMLNYLWTVSPGNLVISGGGTADSSITIQWKMTGPQWVAVIYTSPIGCPILPYTLNFTVFGATLTGKDHVCELSEEVYVTQPGMGNEYAWEISGGTKISGGGVSDNICTILWNAAGQGLVKVTYTYTYTSGNTCTSSDSIPVTVRSLPACSITGSDTICPLSAGNIFSAPPGMSVYAWSISGAGSIQGSATGPVVNVTAGGNNTSFNLSLSLTDEFSCSSNCTKTVTVRDMISPLITSCPPGITISADPGMTYGTLSLPAPVYSDNCTPTPLISVSWTMSVPTPGSGNGIIPAPFQFNIGTTSVVYTFTDINGNFSTCAFDVIVDPIPPDIVCQPMISQPTDPNLCSASLDPGFPTLITGTPVVSYSWVMTGATAGSGNGPIMPDPFTFNMGATIITWTATNMAGSDVCSQTVTVTDNQPPAFSTPLPSTYCVQHIDTATYWDPTMDITPDRPEYYLFTAGNTSLDIAGINDNCCSPMDMIINWTINFTPTPDPLPPPDLINWPPISGTGQPSSYGFDIHLPGDGVIFNDIVHTITYQVTDCNGNISPPVTVSITIKPRPNVIKQN